MDRRLTLFLLVIALGLNLAPFRAAGAQPAQLVAPDLERGTFQDTNAEGEEASAAAPADIPAAERAALIALYNSTNGPNWKNHTGWLVNEDLCTWYGVVCWFHVYVSQISLSNNGLQGTLPSELGNFTNLRSLSLGANQLTGAIPATVGNLSTLGDLHLDNNQLSGSIPPSLGNLTQLKRLNLSNNRLTGTIPEQFGNLAALESLFLGGNQLTGSIPSVIGNLPRLKYLNLANNRLSGAIPNGIASLTALELFDAQVNQLSGELPPELGNLVNMRTLKLNNNQLTGSIPDRLGDLVELTELYLYSNQLGGEIPDRLGRLIRLRLLDLSNNKLVGAIPGELAYLERLESLALQNNQLTGPIPAGLGDLLALQALQLNNNRLSGPIPLRLANLTNLVTLNLDSNQLTGPIPESIGNARQLKQLHLNNNRLSGTLPASLTNLTNLEELRLYGNQLSGPIPPALGNLTQLNWLNLGANQLSGRIPDSIANLTRLRFLGLSRNQLEGTIPTGLGNLTNLTNLYLGRNAGLTGPLPQGLAALHSMYQFTYDNTDLCMPNNDAFRGWLQEVKARGGVQTSWKICGIEPHLSFSTPNALAADVVLLHARLVDAQLGRIRGSTQVSATVTGVEGSLQLGDNGTDGDLLGLDGHYSRWLTVEGADTIEAILHYKGWPVISTTLTLLQDPRLIVLTDLRRLDGEFTQWGTTPGEDLDGNNAADFYDLVDRLWRYTEKYRGIVYDLGHTITRERGFTDDYDLLSPNFPKSERNMGHLIRDLMARIYADTGESIEYLVIAGSRPVVPMYVVDMGGEGNRMDFRRSDLPYAMRSFSTPQQEQRPAPDILYGRISAGRPSSLAALVDVYEQPLVTDPQANAFTLYREDDAAFQVWGEDWQPWVTSRFLSADAAHAPSYAAGHYYFYEGAVLEWRDVDVLQGLSGAAWTVLCSHGSHDYNHTQESHRLVKTSPTPPESVWLNAVLHARDYASIARQPGHLFINAGCWAGFPPQAGNGVYVSQAVMDRHFTYVGNPSYGREYDDTLWVAFADQLTLSSTPTVGAAWVGAYGPYWARYDASDSFATEQAYAKALYGLPTQPLQHTAGGQATVVATGPLPPVPQVSPHSTTATQYELALSVDVPQFAYEYSAAGAVVRPASGGSVLAEDGQPILPLVAARVLLPAGTTAVTVTEVVSERRTEAAGQIDLQIAKMPLRCSAAETSWNEVAQSGDRPQQAGSLPYRHPSEPLSTVPDAVTGTYPATSFRANVVRGESGWVLYLSAIPASYAANHQLTLFHHMSFRICYAATAPAVAVSLTGVTVNDDRPVSIGQANVPLRIGVTTGQAVSLTITYEVADPAGFTLADGQAAVALPVGAHQVTMTLDTRGWSPGPKLLNVTVAGADGIYDTRVISITPQGLRLNLQAALRQLPGLPWALNATVRDATGAPVSGLATRFSLALDGTPVSMAFVEGPSGIYRASVPSSALPTGTHRAVVTVSDAGGHMASDEAWVAIGVFNKSYLPLTLRR